VSLHGPMTNINIHADKDIPAEIIGTVVKIIDTYEQRYNAIHLLTRPDNGDIDLLKS
jgi:hypothetical protein